jgi:hypothetical protein
VDKMLAVIVLLGCALLGSIAAITFLAAQSATVPDVLQNLAVGSLTGLAGVLARPTLEGVDTPRGEHVAEG